MNYKPATAGYLKSLKKGDTVYVVKKRWPSSLYPNDQRLKTGTFVRVTPTGKLSVQIGKEKIWVNSNGTRTISTGTCTYVDYDIVEQIESEVTE